MHIALYVALSLDGYIARPDGSVDWLSAFTMEGEDYGYGSFYDAIDTILMGRKTYRIVRELGPWPYAGKRSYVLTSQDPDLDREDLVFLSGDLDSALAQMSRDGARRIWLVGGGELTAALQRRGRIDEYILSIMPLVLGEGIPLFPPPGLEEPLRLVESGAYANGVVQLRYERRGR